MKNLHHCDVLDGSIQNIEMLTRNPADNYKWQIYPAINVQKCGIFLYKNKPYLVTFPDGLIGQETI